MSAAAGEQQPPDSGSDEDGASCANVPCSPVATEQEGRRIYIHEETLAHAARASEEATDAIYSMLVRVTANKLFHHLIGEDAVGEGSLAETEARRAVKSIEGALPVTATATLRRLVGPRTDERGGGKLGPLLNSDEEVVATCYFSRYYTFATGAAAARAMFSDTNEIAEIKRKKRLGQGYADMSILSGPCLTFAGATPGTAAGGGPLDEARLAAIRARVSEQARAAVDEVLQTRLPRKERSAEIATRVREAFGFALSKGILSATRSPAGPAPLSARHRPCVVVMNPAFPYADEIAGQIHGYSDIPPDAALVGLFTVRPPAGWESDSRQDRYVETFCVHGESSAEAKARAAAERILERSDLEVVAVLPIDDRTVVIGALLAGILRRPWIPADTAALFKDKLALKSLLRDRTALRVNPFKVVVSEDAAVEFWHDLGRRAVVVKPTNAGGTRHVYTCRSEAEVRMAVTSICGDLSYSWEETLISGIMVEQYVGGVEYCVDGQTDADGNVRFTDVFRYEKVRANGRDHVYSCAHYFHPLASEVPAGLLHYTASVLRATKLFNAPFHIEIKVDGNGPCLIEAACRLAGGGVAFLADRINRGSVFRDAWLGYAGALRYPGGVHVPDPAEPWNAAIVLPISEESGWVREVTGLEDVRRLSSFVRFWPAEPHLNQRVEKTVDLDTCPFWMLFASQDPQRFVADVGRARTAVHLCLSAKRDGT